MLGISLIFVGITLILNGIFLWKRTNKTLIIVMNLFTGFIILFFNLYSIIAGDQTKLVGYMGGLLFGLTNLLIAIDKMCNSQPEGTGYFCLLATICAIALSSYYFYSDKLLAGIAWIVWCLIWLFSFIGFALHEKFLPAVYIMFIAQGAISTGLLGFFLLFKIIAF